MAKHAKAEAVMTNTSRGNVFEPKTLMEVKKRAAGIEPASSAWKAEVLPLNYARSSITISNFSGLMANTINTSHSAPQDKNPTAGQHGMPCGGSTNRLDGLTT
jgi:hypothetical protein